MLKKWIKIKIVSMSQLWYVYYQAKLHYINYDAKTLTGYMTLNILSALAVVLVLMGKFF